MISLIFFRFVFIGEQGIEVFWREAQKRNICIALRQKVPSDANNETYENVSLLDGNLKIVNYILSDLISLDICTHNNFLPIVYH